MRPSTGVRAFATAAAVIALLAGCSAAHGAKASMTPTLTSALTIHKGWMKAADSGMTSAFADVQNSSSKPITIVSASSSVSPDVQLHETVEDSTGATVMRQKKGGFVVPAHGVLALAPGGDHLMLMKLSHPVTAGQEVPFTLVLSDGSTSSFVAAVKDFTGAGENYSGGMDSGK